MKKYIAILGLSAFLACGTLFAMNYPNKQSDQKTELNENIDEDVCAECWDKKLGKDALGLTQIKIFNNCSYDITVTYEYWNGKDRWVPVKFGVDAGDESSWWPANSFRKLNCVKSK